MGELVALLLLSFGCLVTVNVLWLFLRMPWVGLQFVIVVFPGHTQLHFTCLPKRPRQTLQIQLLQSDQGLPCLLF